jgi:hypothetical protein
MPPKAAVTTPSTAATTSRTGGDTSMSDDDSQVVTRGQLQEMVDRLTDNNAILENRLNDIGIQKMKLPSIERFAGERSKLKGFLTQMHFKVTQEAAKLATPMDQVAYAGLFLTGRALEWFEPYLTEIQANAMATPNKEVRFMFSSWEGFAERLTQMFGDPEAKTTAERKLQDLVQRTSAIEYTTQFQTLATQVEWNDEALMAQYKRGLKAKVQDAIILMEDAENLRELIDQAIKIDNRIYQREQAKKGQDRVPQSYKAQSTQRPKPVQKPWYGAEPMDLSGTKEDRGQNRRSWKPRGRGSGNHRTREQRPNQGSQQQMTFRRTPQQEQWYKDGACMNCGKKGHYARDCRGGQSNHAMKGTRRPADDIHVQRDDNVLRGTKECSINSFAFCYNNACRIHEDAKYGASYWPQEPESRGLRGTQESDEELDRLYELDKDEDGTASQQSAEKVLAQQFQSAAASTRDRDDRTVSSGKKATKGTNWGYPDLKNALEAEDESVTETGTSVGIDTPLDTMSIASREGRRGRFKDEFGRSLYDIATSPLDKGKRPQAQDSQAEMRDNQDSQNAMRTAQGPTTDENRWSRAAAQFKDIRMSTGRRFPQMQDSQDEMSEIQDSQDEMSTSKTPSWTKAGTQLKKEASTGLKFPWSQDFRHRMRSTAIPGEHSVQPEDQTVDTKVTKQENFEDPTTGRKPKENMEEFRQRIFAWQKRDTESKTQDRSGNKVPVRRVTNRPRVNTPRAKWLTELEEEEDLGIPTRFEERHTKGCHDAASTRYFLTDRSYTLNQIYGKWYRQRHNDEWEDFYMWLDEKVVQDQAITEKRMSHIKGALIMTSRNLEERSEDWRSDRQISVPANETQTFRSPRQRFELKDEDEPRVDPKHPAHHTLSWIACVDDMCEMHKAPKVKNKKYPERMYWAPDERQYRNAKFMHGWHPVEVQETNDLTLQPGRFLTEECLDGRQWWECPENTCPWHVEEKKRTKHWPTREPSAAGSSSQQSGKGEAHGTRGNQW